MRQQNIWRPQILFLITDVDRSDDWTASYPITQATPRRSIIHECESSPFYNITEKRESQQQLVNGIEILLAVHWIRLDCFSPCLPIGRAHLTVLVHELESLHQAEGLVHRTTDGAIVDSDLSQHTFVVDDEQASETECVVRER